MKGKYMDTKFLNYDIYRYEEVRRFLIDVSHKSRSHINWNWARWEWMHFHPEFDRSISDKIGLWYYGGEVVGAAIYDHYLGEAFFCAKAGFEQLRGEIVSYMLENFNDENGLGIAVNDNDAKTADFLLSCGFTPCEQTENVLELSLEGFDFEKRANAALKFSSLEPKADLLRHHKMLWKGFDHGGEAPVDEETLEKQRRMLSAPNLNPRLHIAIENEDSEFIAYCGLWYDKATDYVYVEPVCTASEHRGKGLAGELLNEALRRSYEMGAKTAYVISDLDFYKRFGFSQHSHYTFYWKK